MVAVFLPILVGLFYSKIYFSDIYAFERPIFVIWLIFLAIKPVFATILLKHGRTIPVIYAKKWELPSIKIPLCFWKECYRNDYFYKNVYPQPQLYDLTSSALALLSFI